MKRLSRLVPWCAAAVIALAPSLASAQLTAIRSGLQDSANKAGFATSACNGATCLTNIIGLAINAVLSFVGVILLGLFLLAGFKWMTSDGDQKGATEARAMIKNAVVGMVILVSAYAMASFVLNQLGNLAGGSSATNQPSGAPGPTCPPGSTDPTCVAGDTHPGDSPSCAACLSSYAAGATTALGGRCACASAGCVTSPGECPADDSTTRHSTAPTTCNCTCSASGGTDLSGACSGLGSPWHMSGSGCVDSAVTIPVPSGMDSTTACTNSCRLTVGTMWSGYTLSGSCSL